MDRERLKNIADFYNHQEKDYPPLGGRKVVCGVVINNKEKAIKIMEDKKAIVKHQSKHQIVWKINDEEWIWVADWGASCKGRRFYKVIIDQDIDKYIFNYLIQPRLANYCCSFEVV